MDVFVVDRQYRRRHVVDYYMSFIWTERYSAKGDFEMIVASTQETRTIFKVGQYIAIDESDRLMEILEVEDATDEEGRRVLTIKGYSLEYLLEERVALSPGATQPPFWWRTRRTPSSHARNLYREICYANVRDTRNHYNSIDIDETPRPGTIPEPAEPQLFEAKPRVLYEAIQEVCQGADLGFAIQIKDLKNMHTMDLPFVYRVYTGYDRTTTQSAHAPVVFSPDLDNLQNTKSLVSSAREKNVALVICNDMFLHVWPENVPTNIASRNRKVLLVNMDEHTDMSHEDMVDLMRQRGREALAEHRVLEVLDGEIDHYSTRYQYGRDYGLGDLVELRNVDGTTNQMMVTEQIFASDEEGHRWFPTLTLHEYVQPGSWMSWSQNRQWESLTDEEWRTMP